MNQLGFLCLILLCARPIASVLSFQKEESDACFILQTNPDILARCVRTDCLGSRMSYFIMPVIQILFNNYSSSPNGRSVNSL